MGGRGASSSTAKANNKNDGYTQSSSTIKANMSVVKNITENYPSILGNNRYYFEGASVLRRVVGLRTSASESSYIGTDGKRVSFKDKDVYDYANDKTWVTDDGIVHTTWKAGGKGFTNAIAARCNMAAENLKKKRS